MTRKCKALDDVEFGDVEIGIDDATPNAAAESESAVAVLDAPPAIAPASDPLDSLISDIEARARADRADQEATTRQRKESYARLLWRSSAPTESDMRSLGLVPRFAQTWDEVLTTLGLPPAGPQPHDASDLAAIVADEGIPSADIPARLKADRLAMWQMVAAQYRAQCASQCQAKLVAARETIDAMKKRHAQELTEAVRNFREAEADQYSSARQHNLSEAIQLHRQRPHLFVSTVENDFPRLLGAE